MCLGTKSGNSNHSNSRSPSPQRVQEAAGSLQEEEQEPQVTLNADLLELLGGAHKPPLPHGENIHKDVALRWSSVLQSGLEDEVRKSLVSKYPIPGNCRLLAPPKVNSEVAAGLAEAVVKRDNKLSDLQEQLGSSLAALGQVMSLLLVEKSEGGEAGNTRRLVELVSDAARLIADDVHCKSESRRHFLLAGINKDVSGTIADAPIGEWLFGEELADRIKTAKELERSSSLLKVTGQDKKPAARFLNRKRPPPRTVSMAGGRKQNRSGKTQNYLRPQRATQYKPQYRDSNKGAHNFLQRRQ